MGELRLFSSMCAIQPCWCCVWRDCQWCLQGVKTETPLGTARGNVGTHQLQLQWPIQPLGVAVGSLCGTGLPGKGCLLPRPEGWDGMEVGICAPFPSGPLFLPGGGGKEAPDLILCDSFGSGICVYPWFWICLLNSLLLFSFSF